MKRVPSAELRPRRELDNAPPDRGAHGSRGSRSVLFHPRVSPPAAAPSPSSGCLCSASLHNSTSLSSELNPGAETSRLPPPRQERQQATSRQQRQDFKKLDSAAPFAVVDLEHTGWKPESSGDENSPRVDFTGELPEASGKDNIRIHSSSRGEEHNSLLRRLRFSLLQSLGDVLHLGFHCEFVLIPLSALGGTVSAHFLLVVVDLDMLG